MYNQAKRITTIFSLIVSLLTGTVGTAQAQNCPDTGCTPPPVNPCAAKVCDPAPQPTSCITWAEIDAVRENRVDPRSAVLGLLYSRPTGIASYFNQYGDWGVSLSPNSLVFLPASGAWFFRGNDPQVTTLVDNSRLSNSHEAWSLYYVEPVQQGSVSVISLNWSHVWGYQVPVCEDNSGAR